MLTIVNKDLINKAKAEEQFWFYGLIFGLIRIEGVSDDDQVIDHFDAYEIPGPYLVYCMRTIS